MRSKLVSFLFGLSLVGLTAAPSFACAYHDQQASTTQQKTAQAEQSDNAVMR